MFEFMQRVVQVGVPIFVVATMLNIGLTQKPLVLIRTLRWGFVWRMLLANFVLVPSVALLLLHFTNFDLPIRAGILIFAFCAGAPFLIKLVQAARQDLALAAATMLLLMIVSVAYVPVMLPLFLPGAEVDAWAIGRLLLLQMILPLILGLVLAQLASVIARFIQPWIGLLANLTLYIVIVATLIGYYPQLVSEILGTGAILALLVLILAAFAIGYFLNPGSDRLQDVGALGTAQRNTAAGLIIAAENFAYPSVLVLMAVANTLGILMLLFLARRLSLDNLQDASKTEVQAPLAQ
jgi:bile acid:Na+ symporter, BASS family